MTTLIILIDILVNYLMKYFMISNFNIIMDNNIYNI